MYIYLILRYLMYNLATLAVCLQIIYVLSSLGLDHNTSRRSKQAKRLTTSYRKLPTRQQQ